MIETKKEVRIGAIDRSQQFMEITDFNSMILQNIQLCDLGICRRFRFERVL